jgi:hypothetical protein
MRTMRSHLSFANVMSVLAVFIAIGGGAYAAGIAKDSVKSKQIKAGAVKSAELADNAVTSTKVKDGSLHGNDFAAGELPAGPAGADAANVYAYVGSAGNLIYGKGAVDAARTSGFPAGDYTITFDRDLTNCVGVANVGTGNPVGDSGLTTGGDRANVFKIDATSVEVSTRDTNGLASTSFTVALFC